MKDWKKVPPTEEELALHVQPDRVFCSGMNGNTCNFSIPASHFDPTPIRDVNGLLASIGVPCEILVGTVYSALTADASCMYVSRMHVHAFLLACMC
jgi:hypothetical protein